MKKHTLRIMTLFFVACLLCQPLSVCAAESLDVNRECSLLLEYSSNDNVFSGTEVKIYRVAELYADGDYALIAPFDQIPVNIHGITSQKEWQDAANTLAAYITAQQIQPTAAALTDSAGKAHFEDLQTGIYLVLGITVENDTAYYRFENFCVFLPRPQSDGSYDYHLEAKPKSTLDTKPSEPEEEDFQVVKLWKDTGIRNQRPKSITVAILKNGAHYKTLQLSKENDWSATWSAPAGKDRWTVIEKDVPDPYKVVITESRGVFTITNSRPAPQGEPPKTGDSFALGPWLGVMSVSGFLLIAWGILQKRKSE